MALIVRVTDFFELEATKVLRDSCRAGPASDLIVVVFPVPVKPSNSTISLPIAVSEMRVGECTNRCYEFKRLIIVEYDIHRDVPTDR